MEILITGGSGRLGNVLVRSLINKGYKPIVLVQSEGVPQSLEGLNVKLVKGNILDRDSLKTALTGIDTVFHLAAKIWLYPDKDGSTWAINVEGTKNMGELALEAGVSKFVHCSSHAALEAKPFNLPFDETRELAIEEETVYHRSKAHAEKEILKLVKLGLPAVIVNPGTITGPYDFEPSILGKALIDFIKGKVPFLMEGVSDYADVRDIAEGIISASEKGKVGDRYLLTGEMLPMKSLPKLLSEITGRKLSNKVLPLWLMYLLLPFMQLGAKLKGELPLLTKDMLLAAQLNPNIKNDKAVNQLGFSPRGLKETFTDTIEWYKSRGWL